MTLTILGLLGTVLGLAVWWIRRRTARRDDPKVQEQKRVAEADRVVARHDSTGVNVFVQRELDRLQNETGSDRGGPDHSAAGGGSGVDGAQ